MKVVLLIAGKGRRLNEITTNNHKSLINLDNKPLLHYLIENCIYSNLSDLIPIVGHCSDKVLAYINNVFSEKINIVSIKNEKFNETNNLYSLYCARHLLENEDFILCNGDIVVDKEIIKGISSMSKSCIAIDDSSYSSSIDSPSVITEKNKILDLGRHIPFENNMGYAIGIYKFNKKLSNMFFKEAEKILSKDVQAGFHDPLMNLFDKTNIYKYSVQGYLWTDIDTFDDIEKARKIHNMIQDKYNNE